MSEFPMSREDLEDIMGCHVYEWQWTRLKEHFESQRKVINISKEELFTNRPDLISVITEEMRQNSMVIIRGHNHISLGRRGDCIGCQNQIPDQINPDAPEGCTYTFEDNSIDGDFVCNRHGFFAPESLRVNANSTTPCRAIQ